MISLSALFMASVSLAHCLSQIDYTRPGPSNPNCDSCIKKNAELMTSEQSYEYGCIPGGYPCSILCPAFTRTTRRYTPRCKPFTQKCISGDCRKMVCNLNSVSITVKKTFLLIFQLLRDRSHCPEKAQNA